MKHLIVTIAYKVRPEDIDLQEIIYKMQESGSAKIVDIDVVEEVNEE